jgi:hypothetical protein
LVEPEGPESIDVSGAAVSTTTVRVFETGEVLPALSVEVAVYACEPSATPVSGLDQVPPPVAVTAPLELAPSKISTTEPASAVPERVKLPELLSVPSAGLVIWGAGGAVTSTAQERTAGVGSVLPAWSVARTRKV